MTNGAVITSTNSVAKEAVQGVTTSAGAADVGKIGKLNAVGIHDPSTLGTGVASNSYLRATSSTTAVWTAQSSASSLARRSVYTASASWTNSFSITNIYVEAWGGGGNGANGFGGNAASTSGGGGGGSGSYCAGNIAVTNNQVIAFTVGGVGSSTTIDVFTAGGGTSGSAATAGVGGTASGAPLNINGEAAANGSGTGSLGVGFGGAGGHSPFGGLFGHGGHGGGAGFSGVVQAQGGQAGGQGAVVIWY